jgi:hypothetical protein
MALGASLTARREFHASARDYLCSKQHVISPDRKLLVRKALSSPQNGRTTLKSGTGHDTGGQRFCSSSWLFAT